MPNGNHGKLWGRARRSAVQKAARTQVCLPPIDDVWDAAVPITTAEVEVVETWLGERIEQLLLRPLAA